MADRFARGGSAVMAGAAGAEHLLVIHPGYRNPGARGMAAHTVRGGADMAGRFARGSGTVMTAAACPSYLAMVESGPGPCRRCMTLFTVVAAWDVRTWLAGCLNAIVAGLAIAGNQAVVKAVYVPGRCHMTLVALA